MRIISKLASKLPWLTITPLGAEVDPDREYQQRACSGGGTLGEPAGQCGGAAIEFGKGYRGVLVAAIGQRDIGAVVRLYRRAVAEQGGQRGQGGNNGEVAVSRRRHP